MSQAHRGRDAVRRIEHAINHDDFDGAAAAMLKGGVAVADVRALHRGLLLVGLCRAGRVEVLRELAARAGLGARDLREWGDAALIEACAHGRLAAASWVRDACGLSTLADLDAAPRLVYWAIVSGPLESARWLRSDLGLDRRAVRADDVAALRHACGNARRDAATWLVETFGLTKADAVRARALPAAAAAGDLEMARWLAATLGYTAEDVRASGALRDACAGGHAHVVEWLVTAFALGAADTFGAPPLDGTRPAAARWLVGRFGAAVAPDVAELARVPSLEARCNGYAVPWL